MKNTEQHKEMCKRYKNITGRDFEKDFGEFLKSRGPPYIFPENAKEEFLKNQTDDKKVKLKNKKLKRCKCK